MTARTCRRRSWTRCRHARLLFAFLLVSTTAAAQQKLLTIDDIYDPDKRATFSGNPPTGLTWIDGSHYAWPRDSGTGSGIDWVKVEAATGAAQPLFQADRMEGALARVAGVSPEAARRATHSRDLVFDKRFSAALAAIDGNLYAYDFTSDRAIHIAGASGDETHPSFSPNGRLVAFVRNNNIFISDVATGRETALTTDDTARLLNGTLDWVYEEEIYGRGQKKAYWWSPDSSHVAFLQIDDSPVPTYTTIDDIPYEPVVERWDYPKAGDPNPIVRLGVAEVTGAPPTWLDISKYPAADRLIIRVGWTPDSRQVVFEVSNRTQTWLDLNIADLASGTTRTILRESSKYWINSEDASEPTWLKDGSFLWPSERSGWKHLYHHAADGSLVRQITDGKWEVRTLHGVDEASGWIYFSGTERSHVGSDVYRIKLDGTAMERLSKAEGSHRARFAPDFSRYLDYWSDVKTPIQVRLHKSDGAEAGVIDGNKVTALADYRLAGPEFVQVATRDGFLLEAMMIKPPDFDPSRRYPVYQYTYAGPHRQTVRNAWGGTEYLYHQLLAQKGIIVWICDNRTASGKGIESVWPLYRNLGELELRDIEDGLNWLKKQPYVDGARIGIHGWSYGGYMTSYALTHSTSFAMGIAGGTVADWRDYDTVYTERYMGLPKENPEGYRKSSPRWAAKDLHGALLLVHGAIDDNVHPQNTMQLVYELQKAQKPFRLMLYPKARHGVTDQAQIKHLRTTMLEFTLEHLKPEAVADSPPTSR